jgi:hypothetical protein
VGSPTAPSARWAPPSAPPPGLAAAGQAGLGRSLHDAASAAFFHGFETAVLVAAGIAVAGAVMAAVLIPSQPPQAGARAGEIDPLPVEAG